MDPGVDYRFPTVKLSKRLNLNEAQSNSGTEIEIDSSISEEYGEQPQQQPFTFFDDGMFNNLYIGNEDTTANISNDDDMEPFELMAKTMEDISGDGGVKKMMVRPGVGTDIVKGSSVEYHYTAYLEYSDEPFDSTHIRNKPQLSRLDYGDIISGLNIALTSMRKLETSRFLIAPNYAFGKYGCPPRIPANATILYEVQIVNVYDHAAADAFEELDIDQQIQATFSEKLSAARGFHKKGNDYFKVGSYRRAKDAYKRACIIMDAANAQNQEEDDQRHYFIFKMKSNLAQVYLELKEPAQACTQCQQALDLPGEFKTEILAKIYFRYGKAKSILGHFKAARDFLNKAKRLNPNNPDITEELEKTLIKEERYSNIEKAMCQKMFNENVSKELIVKTDDNNNMPIPKIDQDFQNLVKAQINNFVEDITLKELTFPHSLSKQQIQFIKDFAKENECKTEFKTIKNSQCIKLIR